MDWAVFGLWFFAVVGVIAIVIVIILVAIALTSDPTPPYQYGLNEADRQRRALEHHDKMKAERDLNNELHGIFRYEMGSGMQPTSLTLRGELEAIKEHLNIETRIKPAVKPKAVVVKKGKK